MRGRSGSAFFTPESGATSDVDAEVAIDYPAKWAQWVSENAWDTRKVYERFIGQLEFHRVDGEYVPGGWSGSDSHENSGQE